MTGKQAVVLGSGAWGTTFAQVLADAGMSVTIWGRNSDVIEFINSGENTTYLPGINLPKSISATTDISSAMETSPDLIVIAVPTAAIRYVGRQAGIAETDSLLLSLTKGIEPETHRTVHQMLVDVVGCSPDQLAVLSGPNLSREIAERQPTATAVASSSFDVAKEIAFLCHNSYFRPYVSTDVIGCEIAGATKNVIALAIGAAEGMGFGANTRATLMTRGLAEITRLGIAMGANPQTFAGLAGIGDLIATCSSRLSRNYSLGFRLGQGMELSEAISLSPGVAEGARSAKPILELAHKLGVEMPITAGAVAVIHDGASAEQMGEILLGRPQKMDGWAVELLE